MPPQIQHLVGIRTLTRRQSRQLILRAQPDSNKQIIQCRAGRIIRTLGKLAGFVGRLQFAAQSLVFRLVKRQVGVGQGGVLAGRFALDQFGENNCSKT